VVSENQKERKEKKARDLYLAGTMMFEELRDETIKDLLKQAHRHRYGPPFKTQTPSLFRGVTVSQCPRFPGV